MPHQCMQTTCPWWGRRFRLPTAFISHLLTVGAPIRAPSVSERVCSRTESYGRLLLADRDLVPAGGARAVVRAADRVVAAGSSRRDGQVDLVESGADQAGEGDSRRIAPDAAHRKRLEHSGLARGTIGQRRRRQSKSHRVEHHHLAKPSKIKGLNYAPFEAT